MPAAKKVRVAPPCAVSMNRNVAILEGDVSANHTWHRLILVSDP